MCGVIVVDAESFRSTYHGRDAYIHDHCLRYLRNYALFYQLLGSNLFVQVLGDLRVVSYGIDTLVLKNWGKYLCYFAASPFPLQGKTNACSRGSKKDFWRRCRGGLRSSQDIQVPITNPSPSHLHYLPLVFLSPTSPLSFYSPSLSQSSPLFCLPFCLLVWLD